ncbi:acyltransferase family protein [Seonamhaeicola algicola]|uniref:acyltransferase family protein n=1 Tax=Seonamhaeicola algicola TaxID=1719036 RepID=UPI00164C9EE0|nr:acyltransferase [Seonamhaeicola algicola]
MNKINVNNFDFLRVVFATTVALSHLIELSNVNELKIFSSIFNTRLAIDGFFIISGFLIAKSYQNTTSTKQYILRRIKRIVPAYAVVIILSALCFSLISSMSTSSYFTNPQFYTYLLANLSFQNYIEPCLPGVFQNNIICAVNGALWTIKIEEAFYLLIPLFYWLINKKRINIYVLSSIIFIVSVVYFSYFVNINMYRIAKQLPGALAFFVTGIMLYHKFSFFNKWKHHIIVPCLFLFILEYVYFETYLLKPATFGFMIFYIAYNFKFLNNFGKYGDFTYGIYIYHFPLIQTFVYLGLFNNLNPYVASFITLTITLILSVISWYFIELPNLSDSRKSRHKNLFNTSK